MIEENVDCATPEVLDIIGYVEDAFQNKIITNYKYDRITNTISIQLYPQIMDAQLTIKII